MNTEALADLVLSQQDRIDKLIGQNMVMRAVLSAIITTHHDRKAFAERFERMRELSVAKSLYGGAQDASIAEAERVLDELSRPWREER